MIAATVTIAVNMHDLRQLRIAALLQACKENPGMTPMQARHFCRGAGACLAMLLDPGSFREGGAGCEVCEVCDVSVDLFDTERGE